MTLFVRETSLNEAMFNPPYSGRKSDYEWLLSTPMSTFMSESCSFQAWNMWHPQKPTALQMVCSDWILKVVLRYHLEGSIQYKSVVIWVASLCKSTYQWLFILHVFHGTDIFTYIPWILWVQILINSFLVKQCRWLSRMTGKPWTMCKFPSSKLLHFQWKNMTWVL